MYSLYWKSRLQNGSVAYVNLLKGHRDPEGHGKIVCMDSYNLSIQIKASAKECRMSQKAMYVCTEDHVEGSK